MSTLALPCAVIVGFGATPVQVGELEALGFAAVPAFGLFAGVLADRYPRRPLMIAANGVRLLAIASLPLAWAFHAATIAQFFVVAAVCGFAGVVFDTGYAGFLPRLVGSARLADGNAKMAASASVADVVGTSLAGSLVAACGAPVALVLNACTFAYGTFQLARIRCDEAPRPAGADRSRREADFLRDAYEGIAFVRRSRPLRTVAACSALSHFGGAMTMAVFYIFLFREVHLSAAVVGLVLGLSNVGAIGALFAARIAERIGRRRALVAATLVASIAKFVIPLALLGSPLVALVAARVLLSFSGPLFDINSDVLRASLASDAMQGRVAATMRTIVWGALPIGSLAGGWLGGAIGSVETMCVGGAVGAIGATLLMCCPRDEMRVVSAREADSRPTATREQGPPAFA